MAENAENRKTGETAESGENAENGETLKRVRTASAPETLKHETAPASRDSAETVKHVLGGCGIALRTACETVKQRQETQPGKGLGCFTPNTPIAPPETVPHRWSTRRETLKHPPVASSGCAKP